MKTNDEALLKIKYNVLRTVSRLAFEGRLEEERDNIPFKLIPGPKAQFRCCVYKEREIIRQRIRLVEGKCPSDKQSDNIIQVISSACEECPITRFVIKYFFLFAPREVSQSATVLHPIMHSSLLCSPSLISVCIP